MFIYFLYSAYLTSLLVCVCLGGLLHCNLPLSDADCAADQRAHAARCWDRHPVLPLSRPGTTGRPTGNWASQKFLNYDDWCLLWCNHFKHCKQTRAHHVQVSHGSLLGGPVSAGSICAPLKRWGLQGSNAGSGHPRDCKYELYQGRAADSQLTSF